MHLFGVLTGLVGTLILWQGGFCAGFVSCLPLENRVAENSE